MTLHSAHFAMVDRTLMQYFLCLTSRMVNHLICVVIPYLCCDIIMVWYIVELHGLTPLSEVPHSAIYETRLGDMNGFLFHVVLSDGVADPPFPTPPSTFTRFFYKKFSAKTGPYITRNGVSSCHQNLYTFCCGTGAR